MGTLSYSTTMSLDGYIADDTGDFQWCAPTDEIFRLHVDRLAEVSTEVLGRRTYELMTYWDVAPEDGSWGAIEHEFARRWQAVDKVVASSTLGPDDLGPGAAHLVADLGIDRLEAIVAAADGDVEISGPTTAAEAIRCGLVTDFRFFVVPKIVGGGLAALPGDADLDLELLEQRRFAGGTTYLHYARR